MEEFFENINQGEKNRQVYTDQLLKGKYNLDVVLSTIANFRQRFFEKGMTEEERAKFPQIEFKLKSQEEPVKIPIDQNVYVDLITLIDVMSPSLTAPFYHYNNYIERYCEDMCWDDIKWTLDQDTIRPSGKLRRTSYQIEIQASLLALKAGLDRLVGFFSYFYKGISPHTTFGRYKEDKDKYEGFMFTVNSSRENDQLMDFIHEQYFAWIKIAVAPRDLITHYNDLGLYYEYDVEIERDVPYHFNNRLIKDKTAPQQQIYAYSHEHLRVFTEQWMMFIDTTFNKLLEKSLINYRPKM
jgi:hypothetical protein